MNDLAILGTGSLTPGGAGPAGLFPAIPPTPTPLASLRRPDESFPTLLVPDATLQRWAREPRLRRASRITLLLAEAASQALDGVDPGRLAIVGAFFTGPCHHSRLFFQPVAERGASFASPALFPETVYNSCLSHVATLLGVTGSCYAVVGDDSAWVTALHIAATWLDLDTADTVLVLGGEELDASAVEAYAAAGWLKRGFLPAEGSAALLVGRPRDDTPSRITALLDGVAYRSKASARRAAKDTLALMTDAPIGDTAGPEKHDDDAPRIAIADLGHAFTATAGWHTIRAHHWLRHLPSGASLWVPVWGRHHQFSGLRLQRGSSQSLAGSPPPG